MLVLAPALVLIRPAPNAGPATVPARACAVRPALYRIDLAPTDAGHGASGVARLEPPPSPFGIALTPDGHVLFQVRVMVQGLPAPAPGHRYVAWATTTPSLDRTTRIGVLGRDLQAVGDVSYGKFIVLVTDEGAPPGARWAGPVLLRGFSPSTFLQNFSSHALFMGGMPPC